MFARNATLSGESWESVRSTPLCTQSDTWVFGGGSQSFWLTLCTRYAERCTARKRRQMLKNILKIGELVEPLDFNVLAWSV